MKITAVEAIPVFVPLKPVYGRPRLSKYGVLSHLTPAIVLIHTDQGITGVGEISSFLPRQGVQLAADCRTFFVPLLIGRDPFQIAQLSAALDERLDNSAFIRAGIEMALFDIVGKALGRPVYDLLGGKCRDEIPLSYSLARGAPSEMARDAARFAAEGFRTLKVKAIEDAETTVAAVRAVREAVGPGCRVRVDANTDFKTVAHAARILDRLTAYDIESIEQPLATDDLDGHAELRAKVNVPVMLDESAWDLADVVRLIRRGAADVVNIYVAEAGGLRAASHIFAACAAAHLRTVLGSVPECGIGTAAQMHLGVAVPNLDLDSDACGAFYFEETLVEEELSFAGGRARPSDRPGLGVTVNRAAVERLRHGPAS